MAERLEEKNKRPAGTVKSGSNTGNVFDRLASTIQSATSLYATSAESVGSARVRAANASAGFVPQGTLPNYVYGDQTQNPPLVNALGNIPPVYLYIGGGLLLFVLLRKK